MADYTQEVPERYRVYYERVTGTFRILDLWAEGIKNLPVDADIPIDSPAMKILTQLETNALLGKIREMGWLDREKNSKGELTSVKKIPSLQQIAIENITKIVSVLGLDESVAKEAMSAIREMVREK